MDFKKIGELKPGDKVELDAASKAWFDQHPNRVRGIMQCPKCGLCFLPSLEKLHECRKEKNA